MESIKQGEKLMLLIKRDPRSNDEKAKALGVDKSYLPKLYKLEKLPRKPMKRAQEVYGVPESYFTEMDSIPPDTVAEPLSGYRSGVRPGTGEWMRAQEEIAMLRDEIAKLNRLLEQEKSINAHLAEALKTLSALRH